MKPMTLRSRLLLGFVVMALMVLGLAGFLLMQESRFRAEIQLLADQQTEVQNRLQDLREQLSAMQRNAFQGGLLRDKKLLLYATGEATQLYEVFDTMRAIDLGHGELGRRELLAFLDATEQLYREVTPRSFAVLAQLSEGIVPDPADLSQLRLDNIRLNSAFDAYLNGVRGSNAEQLQDSIDRLQRLRWTSIGMALLALLALAAYLFLVHSHLARPLRGLSAFLAGIGDPAAAGRRVSVVRDDEIGQIGLAMNDMLDKLRDTTVSRDHFNHVLASLSNALLVVGGDGRIVTANQAARALVGGPDATLAGQHVSEVLPPFIVHALEQGAPLHNQEIEFARPGQRATPVLLAMARIAPGEEWIIEATDLTALRESEEKYRQVLDNVTEGIIVLRAGRIVFANPQAATLGGFEPQQLLGKDFLSVVHPDDLALITQRHARRQRGESVDARVDFRIRQPGGAEVWLGMNSVAIDWEGKPALLAFITDITDRKRLEQDLQHTLGERETILQNSIVGIAFLRANGRTKWANQAMADMFGLTLQAHIDTSLEPLYPSREEYLRVGAAVARSAQSGAVFASELQMRRADGSLFWVYLSGRAVNRTDLSQGTVWVAMDISRRKELEEALSHTMAEREAILNSALVGITLTDVDRRHRWVNQRFANMLGYTPQQLIGRSSLLHYPDETEWRALGLRAYAALLAGRPYSAELRMKRRDGSLLWVEMFGACLDAQQPDKGVIWTVLDISERHKAQQDIQAALDKQRELNVLKSSFVAMTSHEFRTPLAAILSSEQLLREYGERLGPSERDELYASIESAVSRMAEMLDKILTIGRGDADLMEFRPKALNLAALCRELADDAVAAPAGAPAGNLNLAFELPDPHMLADDKLLRHILGNLIFNAIKYSPGGGLVQVTVREQGASLVFEVADQGIGIPEAELPRLFDTFHRATNVGNIPGTGLGLAIVKRAVQCHGGSITVQSQPGQGTRFTVQIPCVRPQRLHDPTSGATA
jgi:PAS domain S-box-containing protein